MKIDSLALSIALMPSFKPGGRRQCPEFAIGFDENGTSASCCLTNDPGDVAGHYKLQITDAYGVAFAAATPKARGRTDVYVIATLDGVSC